MATDVQGVGNPLAQQSASTSRAAASSSGSVAVPDAKKQSDDSVDISSLAGKLKAITESLRDVPVVDTQRVRSVRDALASGALQTDPVRTADKLFELESQLYPGRVE